MRSIGKNPRQFTDRKQAGELLGNRLVNEDYSNPIVIALPRGGVPVAMEVAATLGAPLDVLIVRKIGAPDNPEYGIGAITEDGSYWVNSDAMNTLSVTDSQMNELIAKEKEEVARRINVYREGKGLIDVKGRTVVLVDDGLATGVTAWVGVQYLKAKGALRVDLAVPVCAQDSADKIREFADQVICLESPSEFYAVGAWYQDFSQLTDDEVLAQLRSTRGIREGRDEEIQIRTEDVTLEGQLTLPSSAKGIVIFAHGSGSSRHSRRNMKVAQTLNEAGLGTLLFDLLTVEESKDRRNVFNIPFLASRLLIATQWVHDQKWSAGLSVGYFGASTGGGAALWAAAQLPSVVSAVVSRGGRPDLASSMLPSVTAPVLLIVGGNDEAVIDMNKSALADLNRGELTIIPGATHLFEEPGALEQVAANAINWFTKHLSEKEHKEGSAA